MGKLSGIVETTKEFMDAVETNLLTSDEKKDTVIESVMQVYNIEALPDTWEKKLYALLWNLIEKLWFKFFATDEQKAAKAAATT